MNAKKHLFRIMALSLVASVILISCKQNALSLWTDDAPAKKALVEYVESVTKKGSADYIPVEKRIAVFDMDGTLFCETDPNYFSFMLLQYRVLEDPDYRERATDFEKEIALKVKTQNETGASFPNLVEKDHLKVLMSSFNGFTPAEFNDYVQRFKELPMPSYNGMKRGEGFYRPMLQVVDYLNQNDFTVYIVSGTFRYIVRGIMHNSPLNIPINHVIGSDELLVSQNQNGEDGISFTFEQGDKVVFADDFIINNLKMNKVTVIMQEIGMQPVLSFGNSTGDSSMANFVVANNPHKALAFMLCCDDTVRENGNEKKAEEMKQLCASHPGWVPISMRDDWKTIYGDGVSKK